MYDLPGGGPQGGILIGLFYNLYTNWVTALCNPGVDPVKRFLKGDHPVPEILPALEAMKDEAPKLQSPAAEIS